MAPCARTRARRLQQHAAAAAARHRKRSSVHQRCRDRGSGAAGVSAQPHRLATACSAVGAGKRGCHVGGRPVGADRGGNAVVTAAAHAEQRRRRRGGRGDTGRPTIDSVDRVADASVCVCPCVCSCSCPWMLPLRGQRTHIRAGCGTGSTAGALSRTCCSRCVPRLRMVVPLFPVFTLPSAR